MAQARYSASRVGTFESCKLKYDLSYRRGYYALESQQSVVTRKGTAFHNFAEHYNPEWTPEEVTSAWKKLEQESEIPEEYSLEAPVTRWLRFYTEFIQKEVAAGAVFKRESSIDFVLDGHTFTGKLDVSLEYPDGRVLIIDYKTGKSTSTSYYVDQMALYVLGMATTKGIPLEQALEKISVGIYFAFANPDEPNALKQLKMIRFNQEQVQKIRDNFKRLIEEIESDEWDPEAMMSRMCEWCSFCGFPQYCSATAKAGLHPVRGVKILQKDWAVAAGIK